jgi:hypothetical protein
MDSKEWYLQWRNVIGTDGPAIEQVEWLGKSWWVNGERHRTDGPAIVYSSGWN